MFDNEDIELDPEVLARIQRSQARKSAREELADVLEEVPPAHALSAPAPRTAAGLRTPDEIRGGAPYHAPPAVAPVQDDGLAAHYRLLGVEQGADFATVQAVYDKLSSRCSPDKFPPGSPEAAEAQDIHNRLEATYKALREALDPTARRFDMLDI